MKGWGNSMKNKVNKVIFVTMLTTIILSMVIATTYADFLFAQNNVNIPSEWALAEVKKAEKADLLPEDFQGKYDSFINREDFCEIAVKLYEALSNKKATYQGKDPFIDTRNEKVSVASSLGIVEGVGEGMFAPKEKINRQEISVMIYRTLKAAKPGYNYSNYYERTFADYNQIASWAREAVGYLYAIEVVNGVGENLFNPLDNTTNEEAIALAVRMYDRDKKSNGNLVLSRGTVSRREAVTRLKLEDLLAKEMGKPYQWGGVGPNSYDCSGLVYTLYGKLGISLPRVASAQAKVGVYVPKNELMYGDLVFFAKDGRNVHHVGIYVGDGVFVHAPQTGDVVKRTTLNSGYYARVYYTAKRVIN